MKDQFWGEQASKLLKKTKPVLFDANTNSKGGTVLADDAAVSVDKYHSYRDSEKTHVDFTPFVYNLLKMEDRIRVFEFGDELVGGKPEGKWLAYYPTKQHLYIPIMLPTVEHQIAHMVEIKQERCTIPDWGLVNFGIDKYSNPSDKHFLSALVR